MGEEYEVGYGKPPKQARFSKGRSGNPAGRPKGHKNKGSVVREIIERQVILRENGKPRKVTVFEALVESTVSKALNGSVNDLIKLLQLIEKHVPEKLEEVEEVPVRPDLSPLSDEDLASLRALAAGWRARDGHRTSAARPVTKEVRQSKGK